MSGRDAFVLTTLALSLLMIGSPWLLGFDENAVATISASGIGGLLVIPPVLALVGRHHLATGAALTLGAWSLLAPIMLGFASELPALTVHMIAGFASMLLAVTSEDWHSLGPPEIRV
jgi:hypothetical protein